MKKYNLARINTNMSYTLHEITDRLNINHKTCLRWIQDGLAIVDGSKKPILILGSTLKKFLTNKHMKKQFKLGRSEFYCLTCKKPTMAKRGSNKILSGRKTALCRVCNGKISRIS